MLIQANKRQVWKMSLSIERQHITTKVFLLQLVNRLESE